VLSWFLRGHQWLNHPDQRRHIMLDNLPHSRQVKVKVIVGDSVAQSNDLEPRNLRMRGSRLVGDLARCLTNVLQGLGDGVLVQGTLLKYLPGQVLTELAGFSGSNEPVEQKSRVTPHRCAPGDSGYVCAGYSSCSAQPVAVRPSPPCVRTKTPVHGSSPTGHETPSGHPAQK
jgi:hypothetical protein